MLGVVLPPWAHSGGTDKLLERLQDEEQRQKMKDDIANGIEGWDNFIQFAGIDQIFVTSVKNEKNKFAIGKSLLELGEIRGIDPLDATFDLLLEEENAVGMVEFLWIRRTYYRVYEKRRTKCMHRWTFSR